VGINLPIDEVSRSHIDTPHSIGLLWKSNRPVGETSTRQHTILTTDRHPYALRDSNPQSEQRTFAHPRLRPRGQQDRLSNLPFRLKIVTNH